MYFPTFWSTFLSIEAKFHRILCQICLYLSVMPKLSWENALNFDFGAHHELAIYGKKNCINLRNTIQYFEVYARVDGYLFRI